MKPSYEELEAKLVNAEAKLVSVEIKLANTEAQLIQTQNLLKLAIDRVTALEERLNKNSNNSSKPPSTDQKSNSLGGSESRKHRSKGFNRSCFSPEQIDHFITCSLNNCPDCGSNLLMKQDKPLVLQQVDLPQVKAVITQFTCTKYKCNHCNETSFAELPKGIPNSTFGPQLMALTATLTGSFHLSKRDTIQLIRDLYGIEIAVGSIINIEERVALALKEVSERVQNAVMTGPFAKHFDETSWRNCGKSHYVWIGSTPVATSFRIDPSRSREAFDKFSKNLNEGPVVTDRYAVYSHLKVPHQYCLAHLIRDFRKYAERNGPDSLTGKALEKELRQVCKNHREFRTQKISERSRNARFRHQKSRIEFYLLDGFANGSDELSGLCNRLLENMHKLWTFSKFTDVDPTNNLAERDLRRIVLWRKKSYGTRSDRGKRFVERISSVTSTARKAGRNILSFVKEAVSAFYSMDSAPEINPSYGF